MESVEDLKKILEEQARLRKQVERLEFEQFAIRVGAAMNIAERILYGEISVVAILSVDEQGRILYSNGRANEMFGYESHELRGQIVEMLVPVLSRGDHVKYREEYVKNPYSRTMGQAINKELKARGKSGNEFPITITLFPTRREGRVVINLQCVLLG